MKREQIPALLAGKTVTVRVDRPIGYLHGDIRYFVNYGYIPGILAEDGEEQDVYILGVDRPLTSFRGKIVAVIRRRNDREDKLVAVPEGIRLTAGEIARAVSFQEQYFDSFVELFD